MSMHLMTSECILEQEPLRVYVDKSHEKVGGHTLKLSVWNLGETQFAGLTPADLERLYSALGAYLSDLDGGKWVDEAYAIATGDHST